MFLVFGRNRSCHKGIQHRSVHADKEHLFLQVLQISDEELFLSSLEKSRVSKLHNLVTSRVFILLNSITSRVSILPNSFTRFISIFASSSTNIVSTLPSSISYVSFCQSSEACSV